MRDGALDKKRIQRSTFRKATVSYVLGSSTRFIKAWNHTNISKEQVLLGVPAYGHSCRVPSSMLS